MAYLDPDHGVKGDLPIANYPAAAAPGDGVSLAAALRHIADGQQGAAGINPFPAAAAPGNGVSLAEVIRAVYNLTAPQVITGEAAIDDSAVDETDWTPLITISPAADAPLTGVSVALDLAKATTGYAAVETTATISFRVARQVDGTNWRGGAPTSAISGTDADGRMVEILVGDVGVDEGARIEFIMSGDATSDIEIPFNVTYRGIAAPTVTPAQAA